MEREENVIYPGMFYANRSPYVDVDGKPVERTKHTHPYGYDAYVTFDRREEIGGVTGCVYSDRLYQWEFGKTQKIAEKVFGDKGQFWGKRDPKKIEKFLQEWYEDSRIQLVLVMEGCNVSNGYPYWFFGWHIEDHDKSKEEKETQE